MTPNAYLIECKHCAASIRLPAPNHRRMLTAENWSRNILCVKCKRVCSYTRLDLRPTEFSQDIPEPQRSPRPTVLSAEFPCGSLGCVSPIRILTVAKIGPDNALGDALHNFGISLIAEPDWKGVTCSKGHPWQWHTKEANNLHAVEDWF
jgi:hypothetical protein